MPDATYVQCSFLGGEYSQWAQGRWDDPKYKTALARCLNAYPVDEGAWVRRPGFRQLGTTNLGKAGRVIPFAFAQNSPYNLEFTDDTLRIWDGTQLITTNDDQQIASISGASPAVFTLPNAVTWKTGDQGIFYFDNYVSAAAGAVMLNRQFILTMVSTTTFTIVDAVTGVTINGSDLPGIAVGTLKMDGAISSSPVSDGPIGGSPVTRNIVSETTPKVGHIAQVATPYAVAGADWHSLRLVQGLDLAMLLHGDVIPQTLQVLEPPTATTFAAFEYSAAQFQDGPYLDPPPNAIATPSALGGVIQLTVGYPAWVSTTTYGAGVTATYSGQDYISAINNNVGQTPSTSSTAWISLPPGGMISLEGFVSTDVGRAVRLFSAPEVWNPGTTYAAGTNVTYNGSYFTALTSSNTDNEPDISLTDWVINTSAAYYTWGTITAVNAPNNVSVQLQGASLAYTTPITSWAIGAWSDTTGWPTCGCYQGGRFWFAGAIPNRVDSSSSNEPFVMSPTQQDGTVTDNNGISYTFNSDSVDQILWMTAITGGILCGTQHGEKLLTSGTNGGPITPSSVAESPTTRYGSADMLPVHTGLSLCFVQRQGRRLLEYLADVFSQRYYGPDLSVNARHIGTKQFQEIYFQQEPAPVVWARMGDGSLAGTTYRRVSLFSTQPPEFNGWHQHQLGSGRLIESIAVGPSNDGDLDTLALVTNDPATNVRYVESMTTLLDENDPITLSWFLDCAITPGAAQIVAYGGQSYVRFYGLHHLDGMKASVFAAALDCGDYVVQNGFIDVPLGTLDPISGYAFDIPQFNVLQPIASQFSSMSVTIVNGAQQFTIPCVIGFNYLSQGQQCRPVLSNDTGARTGPGFGKKKRQSKYAISMVNSLGAQIGVDFAKMQPIPVTSPGGANPPYLSGFTGIRRETLKNDFSFDSMLAWQSTRPFPLVVNNIGGFIDTEDTP